MNFVRNPDLRRPNDHRANLTMLMRASICIRGGHVNLCLPLSLSCHHHGPDSAYTADCPDTAVPAALAGRSVASAPRASPRLEHRPDVVDLERGC